MSALRTADFNLPLLNCGALLRTADSTSTAVAGSRWWQPSAIVRALAPSMVPVASAAAVADSGDARAVAKRNR